MQGTGLPGGQGCEDEDTRALGEGGPLGTATAEPQPTGHCLRTSARPHRVPHQGGASSGSRSRQIGSWGVNLVSLPRGQESSFSFCCSVHFFTANRCQIAQNREGHLAGGSRVGLLQGAQGPGSTTAPCECPVGHGGLSDLSNSTARAPETSAPGHLRTVWSHGCVIGTGPLPTFLPPPGYPVSSDSRRWPRGFLYGSAKLLLRQLRGVRLCTKKQAGSSSRLREAS